MTNVRFIFNYFLYIPPSYISTTKDYLLIVLNHLKLLQIRLNLDSIDMIIVLIFSFQCLWVQICFLLDWYILQSSGYSFEKHCFFLVTNRDQPAIDGFCNGTVPRDAKKNCWRVVWGSSTCTVISKMFGRKEEVLSHQKSSKSQTRSMSTHLLQSDSPRNHLMSSSIRVIWVMQIWKKNDIFIKRTWGAMM